METRRLKTRQLCTMHEMTSKTEFHLINVSNHLKSYITSQLSKKVQMWTTEVNYKHSNIFSPSAIGWTNRQCRPKTHTIGWAQRRDAHTSFGVYFECDLNVIHHLFSECESETRVRILDTFCSSYSSLVSLSMCERKMWTARNEPSETLAGRTVTAEQAKGIQC